MNFRQIVRDYFTFSRNERKGIVVLLILIFILAVGNKMIFYFEKPAKLDTALLDSVSRKLGAYNDSINQHETFRTLFPFNPNTIDSLALDSLNIPEQVKVNLLKFRKNGGKFFKKTDFKKIYGVSNQIYLEVSPFLLFDQQIVKPVTKLTQSVLFYFDPNTASDSEFFCLGLSAKQLASVRKYQKKIGTFKDKEDFLRINVIRDDQKQILSDWIRIEKDKKTLTAGSPIGERNYTIELNSADTVSLKKLPGIGSVLAKRIIKYRDLIGGFYSVDQLIEVYGISGQTMAMIQNKLIVDPVKIKKIDVNFSDLDELSRHPYLQKNLARKIIKYRSKYGKIGDLTILRDSMILNIDEYNRIKPYF